ncbi:carboxylesterase family protein [Actinopolymorpha alba]|uniref:carboxylesterase family protein n=1 Tax=Actinopolymorpha alba TaxID=533267 RepID=UPI0012F6F87C
MRAERGGGVRRCHDPLRCGAVRGVAHDGVHTFEGIPYAKAPVGRDRLCPPLPEEP